MEAVHIGLPHKFGSYEDMRKISARQRKPTTWSDPQEVDVPRGAHQERVTGTWAGEAILERAPPSTGDKYADFVDFAPPPVPGCRPLNHTRLPNGKVGDSL